MSREDDWNGNGWSLYQKLVLKELERLSEAQEESLREISDIKIQLAMLQVKSGVWGLIGGLIPVAITFVILYLERK